MAAKYFIFRLLSSAFTLDNDPAHGKGHQGLLTLFESSLPEAIFSSGKAEGEKYSESI